MDWKQALQAIDQQLAERELKREPTLILIECVKVIHQTIQEGEAAKKELAELRAKEDKAGAKKKS